MKFQVTVEIEVNTDDEKLGKAIVFDMDYSFSFINGYYEQLITSAKIKDIEIL